MIKKIAKKSAPNTSTTVKAKSEAKSKEVVKVEANERLVAALKGHDDALTSAKSYLVDMATIVQEEQLSKEEVLASIMEARGIDRKTAGEQYARVRGLLNNPSVLQELKDGVIDLKTARARTTKKQENPSTKKAAENAEKVIVKAVQTIINKAKESGTDLQSIIVMIKQAAKKGGLV